MLHESKIIVEEFPLRVSLAKRGNMSPQEAIVLAISPTAGDVTLGIVYEQIICGFCTVASVGKDFFLHHNASVSAGVVTTAKAAARLIEEAPNRIWLRPRRICNVGWNRMEPKSPVLLVT
jgi:hypothetical protein